MTKKWLSWKDYKKQQKQQKQKQEVEEPVHHCGENTCEEDCGELWCGCIDICRGSCGLKEWS
jgi:hypothetical protein